MFIHCILKRPNVMTVTLICLVLTFSSAAFAKENPASALKKLKAGNAKFVKGSLIFPNLDQARRTETFRNGQHPFATVIACSDSRVPVETIFDRGIGDVFVIRVAGNVADTDEVGSIEYGVDHLETPVMVVLGHKNCGAVTAVVTDAELHGSIPPLVDNIKPAVERAKQNNPNLHGKALVPAAVKENVWQSIDDLFRTSPATRNRVKAGTLTVVGAVYDITSGKVEWLGTHPEQGRLLAYMGGGGHDAGHGGFKDAHSPSESGGGGYGGASYSSQADATFKAESRLRKGNERYYSGKWKFPNLNLARRQETTTGGQHPFATVIACSDSRVPVERVFDQGIGDIFVIRVAGNVADTDEVGSIEYGVDHLDTPVFVALGHTNCGAVTAVVTEAELHGSIPPLVDNIIPAVEIARSNNPHLSGKDLVPEAVKMNVWQTIEDLLERSPVTRERVKAGAVKLLGAVYHIEDGTVEWLGTHPNQGEFLTGAAASITSSVQSGSGSSHSAVAAASETSHKSTAGVISRSSGQRTRTRDSESHSVSMNETASSFERENDGSAFSYIAGVFAFLILASVLYFITRKGGIMKNLSIGKKLGGAFGILILLMIISSTLAYRNFNLMDHDVEVMMGMEKEMREIEEAELLIIEQISVEKEFLLTGDEHMIDLHDEYGEEGRVLLKLLEEQLRADGDMRAVNELKEIEDVYEEYEAVFERVAEMYKEGHVEEAIQLSNEESNLDAEHLVELLTVVLEQEAVKVDSVKREIDAAFSASVIEIVVAALIAVLLGVILAVLITRAITNPINKAVELATFIADGNLAIDNIVVKTEDEIGELSHKLNKMKDNLAEIISQVKMNSQEVASAATEIASAAEEASAGATEQEAQTGEVSTSVEQMTATILESSQNATSASESARNAAGVASEGGEVVQQTIEGMQAIAKTVKASAHTIGELGKRSDEIGEIIAVIDDIADQTNLLALNAAIEAARAGEQGRGFAVVADEVRKLAERTTRATAEIASMIKGIQEDTGGAVASMEEGTKQVESGTELAAKAGESLGQIVSVVSEVQTMVEQIATASDEQSAAAEQISGNVGNIATVTRQSAQGAEQMAAASEHLNRQTESLMKLVGQFKLAES